MSDNDFPQLVELLRTATKPESVFGDLSPDAAAGALEDKFREIARIVHPDVQTDDDGKAAATDAFTRLQQLRDEATAKIAAGTYGSKTEIKSLLQSYLLGDKIGGIGATELFGCEIVTAGGKVAGILRLPVDQEDNDLIANEAAVLTRLRAKDQADGTQFSRYLPELIESFPVSGDDGQTRQANAFPYSPDYYSLAEVMAAYPQGVDARTMTWMFNRLLEILSFSGMSGVVHGAILPANVVIQPFNHGLAIVDWCYSADFEIDPTAKVKARIDEFGSWYPPEAEAAEAISPATDIYMTAQCMIAVSGGDPASGRISDQLPGRFVNFLRACLLRQQNYRPNDAGVLADEFKEVQVAEFGPAKYHPFEMPAHSNVA